jgi:hypothetical protein
MALLIEDPRIELLAQQVAALRGVGAGDAIGQALQHELDRLAPERYIERAVAFCRDLKTRAGRAPVVPADKAFFDELSGQP